jgi:hypothetical protein
MMQNWVLPASLAGLRAACGTRKEQEKGGGGVSIHVVVVVVEGEGCSAACRTGVT